MSKRVSTAIALVGLAGVGTLFTLLRGQWSGLLALGVMGALVLWHRSARRGMSEVAGGFVMVLPFAVAKPHLALGLAVWLIGWRMWRVLMGATAAVATMAVMSLLLVGVDGVIAWARVVQITALLEPPSRFLSALALLTGWFGNSGFELGLVAVVTLVGLVACYRLGSALRGGQISLVRSLTVAMLLSLFIAGHLWVSDLAVLTPLLALLAAKSSMADAADGRAWPGQRTSRVLAGWLAINVAGALDYAGGLPPWLGHMTPLALAGCAAALWRWRRLDDELNPAFASSGHSPAIKFSAGALAVTEPRAGGVSSSPTAHRS